MPWTLLCCSLLCGAGGDGDKQMCRINEAFFSSMFNGIMLELGPALKCLQGWLSLVCLKSMMKVSAERLPRSLFLILNHCSAEPMDSSCCIWFSGVVTFFAESNIRYGEQIIAAGGLLSSPFSEKRVPLPKELRSFFIISPESPSRLLGKVRALISPSKAVWCRNGQVIYG